jgi:hypothetical protein
MLAKRGATIDKETKILQAKVFDRTLTTVNKSCIYYSIVELKRGKQIASDLEALRHKANDAIQK